MFFLIQQIISQFGDRQSDNTQYVHKEWIFFIYKVPSYKRLDRQFFIQYYSSSDCIDFQFCSTILYYLLCIVYSSLRLSEEHHLKSHWLTVEDAGRVVHFTYNLHPHFQSGRAHQGEVSETSFRHYHKFAEAVSRVTRHWYSNAYVLLRRRRYVNFITLSNKRYIL